MLADPDGFDNPLLTGLREASDSALENSPTLTRTVKAAAHAVGKNHSRQFEVASSRSLGLLKDASWKGKRILAQAA